jgi:hypothetical protein
MAQQGSSFTRPQCCRRTASCLKCTPQAPVGSAGRGGGHRKQGRSVLRQEPEVKYTFIQNHSDKFKITSMSRVLGVSRNGFYH